MPGGDREANLRNAILCYSGALYVFRSQYMDAYMTRVMADLTRAQNVLQGLGRG